MRPGDVAIGHLINRFGGEDDPAVVLAAMHRFRLEEGMALVLAREADRRDQLARLLELGDRLAAEPDSPTAEAWAAYVARVREARAGLEAGAAGLAGEAADFLALNGDS